MFAAYGGNATTRPADIRIDDEQGGTALRFDRVPFKGRSFESPIYYGYRVAHALPRSRGRLFIGGEFIHAKAYGDVAGAAGAGVYHGRTVEAMPLASVMPRFAMSHGLNFVLANATLRQPIGGRITATATAGAGVVVPHVEAQFDGAVIDEYQLAGSGLQAAIGAELRVWRRLSVMTEYKWTRAAVRAQLHGADAALTTSTHHVAVGVAASY